MNAVDVSWVGVDWGTTHVRAFAMNADDKLINQVSSKQGMASLKPGEYESALLALLKPWLLEQRCLPVYACGMVGAKQGWQEAPYRSVPTSPISVENLSSIATVDKRISVFLLPGLSQANPADVMRGEETQLAGLLQASPSFSGSVCLPGTHSKWVVLEHGVVRSFKTYLTGELFGILSQYSVLKHSVQTQDLAQELDTTACVTAASSVIEHGTSLSSSLFGVRAKGLLNDVPASDSRATLSGLLIGEELADSKILWADVTVTLIGDSRLTQLYAACLQAHGSQTHVVDATEATLAGLKHAKQQHQAIDS